ncbi:MAG: hypothetical protein M3Q23_13840 [Actinomycetota bacterium]|nr:hypothetical protein [Actinomycetota bacterium]
MIHIQRHSSINVGCDTTEECDIQDEILFDLSTPESVKSIQVTYTLTFQYTTSLPDAGVVRALVLPHENVTTRVYPHQFLVNSDGTTTTASATFIAHLPARGRTYSIGLEAQLQDEGATGGSFKAHPVVVVLDARPS